MHGVDFQELPVFELFEKNALLSHPCHVRAKNFFYRKNRTAERHRHSFYAMELIMSGSCIQHINGYQYECAPGAVCLLSPFDYHAFQFPKSDVTTCCLSFMEDVLSKEVLNTLNSTELPCFLQLSAAELEAFTKDLQQLDREIARKNPMYLTIANAIVNKLVIFLLRNASTQAMNTANRKSDIRYSISYIRNHFREPLSLEEIAKTFNVTPNHFCKYFKKITGITFKEYLLQLRLEHAMKQLLLTQDSITDICFESGFNSPSYFTKAFKARFGKTPTACRSTPASGENQ